MVHPVKIKPVQSAIQDKAPTTSEVAQGELAVNVHASSLAIYTLDASGAVAVLADGNRQANIATTNAATAQATADLAVTAVTGTAPIVSTGGLTPALSITAATTSAAGTMSSADKVILDAVSTTYVALAGSTMTGALTLSGDPTLAMNASTKQYTDANDFWTRTGTILSPETAGDGVSIGGALAVTDDLTVNTDALFVDASAKKVGIGTASPANQFEVASASATKANFTHASSNETSLYIESDDTSARIGSTYYGSGGSFKPLAFLTSGLERVRIDSSGVVKIGGTLPSSPNITLTGSTGSASFAGGVTHLGADGAISTNNRVLVQADDSAYTNLWQGHVGGAGSTITSGITPAGDATFAGNVTSGSGVLYSRLYPGYLTISNVGNFGQAFGLYNTTTSAYSVKLEMDGAATFAGSVKAVAVGSGSALYGDASSDTGSWCLNCRSTQNGTTVAYITKTGDADFIGFLSKGSGSFKISHPLPEKTETHHLVHSFIEGPQADLIYSGMVTLVDGKAEINLDTAARMTEGTFLLLNTNLRRFVSNEGGWTAVKSSITGNVLTVEAQDDTCTDEVFWTVIGERKDQHMLETEWTDENGRVITEPLKPVEVEPAA